MASHLETTTIGAAELQKLLSDVDPAALLVKPRLLRRVIKDDGLFMLHTIGSPDTRTTIDPWLEKYIFPGGVLPSLAQIGTAISSRTKAALSGSRTR